MKTISMISTRAVWYGLFYAVLLVFMYYSSFQWLVSYDWAREDYNYCYLIPLVVLYLVWERKKLWSREPGVPSWSGFPALFLGILLFWVGELSGEFFSLYISSWLVVTGLLWMHSGWKKLKTMAFPLFVSLFLFPLPNFINTKLTFNLKLISSEIGIKLIQLLGMSAYREGNIIDLGFTQLQVVDACSGLRYLIPLLLMGLLMAYYYRAALWKRLVVVFSTIFLSIITNSLRIAFTAILYPSMGPAAAEGFFHDFSGWAIFMVSFAILLAEIWVLGKIAPRPDEGFIKKLGSAERSDKEETSAETYAGTESTAEPVTSLTRPQYMVAAFLLVVTLAFYSVIDFREKPPVAMPFSTFPLSVGGWTGQRQFMDQQIVDTLDLSDYVSINYTKLDSMPVNIYVAYYASQQKGKSIHSPETCLPASGWTFRDAKTLTIPLAGHDPSSITVMRSLMEKGGSRQVVYFWFTQRGRILTNAYQLKMYNFWDALVKQRTDGALIRVISPIDQSETIEAADTRLQSFIREIMPLLNEYIPGY